MTTLREAALMALKALEFGHLPVADQAKHRDVMSYIEAIDTLRKALDADSMASLPVAFAYYWPPTNTLRRNPTYQLECGPTTAWKDEIPLYTAPPPREWQGLTDEEINEWDWEFHDLVFEIEAKLKEKNT